MDKTIIIPLIRGKIIILQNSSILHFVTFSAIKLNPILDTKMLKNITIDAPTIPHLIVNG